MEIKNVTKEQWVKALRSGKYKQAKETLVDSGYKNTNPSYCCLGVLACLKANPDSVTNLENPIVGGVLNPKIVNLPLKQQHKLAELNDNIGFNFDKIADYIESHYSDGRLF